MKRWIPYLRNKFIMATLALFGYILFFDSHDLIGQMKMRYDIYLIKQEMELQLNDIEVTQQQIQELTSDPANLEKFAREQYRMKRENEEIFVIVSGQK